MRTNDVLPVMGVVLAGGASRRMGQDKAALALDGEPLLSRVVRLLEAALGQPVMVIGPPERAALAPGARVVPDARPGLGPLGGIVSALQAASTPHIFVAACDMPFLRPALVRYVASLAFGYDVVVPRSARGTEQLCAVYEQGCVAAIQARLAASDRAVAPLYAQVRTREVAPAEWAAYDPDGRSFININTPEEWAHVLERGAF